ncbi:MAG: hypothetical protein ACK2UK_05345 [Candidatus Promineifilaceae bacterium]
MQLENYILVTLVVLFLWITGIIFYLWVSSRQRGIEEEIEEIDELLDRNSRV